MVYANMNRQEAIQEQIDDIMDNCDFKSCVAMAQALIDMSEPRPKVWGNHVEENILRAEARNILKLAAQSGYCSTGYFTAMLKDGEDSEGKWLRLELYFGEFYPNESSSYE